MSDQGLEDSAILLLSLGEEEAAEVLRFLTPKEVQKIGQTMAKLKNLNNEQIESVVSAFQTEAQQYSSIGSDSDGYIRTVLTKALGDDKAKLLLDRILEGSEASGIEGLKWMEPSTVAELIVGEHPQIIASILVHLERDQASQVLVSFPDPLRDEVILRIATLDGIQPAALRELNEVLAKALSTGDTRKKTALNGVKAAAEILNRMGGTHEAAAVESIREYDPDLAQKLLDEMFVFENVLELDDRAIQALLREIQSESLILALKGSSEELQDKIFKNMSQRAADMLRDDLEAKGPVRVSEVEAEQKEILKVVRRMAEEGTIVLAGKGDDQYV